MFAEEIIINWKLNNGDCQDCIEMPIDGLSNYDFGIYNKQLFFSDYSNSRIIVFNNDGHKIKCINLTGKPERITIIGDELVIFSRNNSLAIYKIPDGSLKYVRIEDKFSDLNYSLSFFIDSQLVIPLANNLSPRKCDVKIFNIFKPTVSDTIYGFFNFPEFSEIPSDISFKHRPSNFVDICGGDDKFLVLKRFESNKTYKNSGYMLFSRIEKKIIKIFSIPDEYGLLIHTNAGRGMKIYKDRIYFISEINGDCDNSIVVGSYSLR